MEEIETILEDQAYSHKASNIEWKEIHMEALKKEISMLKEMIADVEAFLSSSKLTSRLEELERRMARIGNRNNFL